MQRKILIEEAEAEQIREQAQQRVNELLDELPEPPYFQVIQNGGGMIDPMHRFITEEDAREYHRMRFGSCSDRKGYLAYHRQNWGGLITRSLRQFERPRVFNIIEERTGRVVYSGLLPSEEYRKESESAYHNPTVLEKIDHHLPPFPDYISESEDPPRFCPEDYDGESQFQWHQEQVRSFSIELATPDQFRQQYGDR